MQNGLNVLHLYDEEIAHFFEVTNFFLIYLQEFSHFSYGETKDFNAQDIFHETFSYIFLLLIDKHQTVFI